MRIKKMLNICFSNRLQFWLLLAFSEILFAQDPIVFPNILPASPDASELGKYGNTPVNLSSGMVDFDIPIYIIESEGFKLPVSISYRYNGLRIDEIPGVLGLGWSLNAGGMITRQIRGRPDEGVLGYIGNEMIGQNYVVRPYNELTLEERNYLEKGSARNELDTEPDRFMLNIAGKSATFYFDENKQIMISPYKPYIIELIDENDFSQGFKVIDDQGVIYFFNSNEYTYQDISEDTSLNPISEFISGWKISKIVYPKGKDISFFYSQYSYLQKVTQQSHSILSSFSIAPSNCSTNIPSDTYKTSQYKSTITSLQLDSIQFSQGKLEFNKTYQDVLTSVNYNSFLARLDNVVLKNLNNSIISNFSFTYDDINKTRKLLAKIEKINSEFTYNFEYLGIPDDDIPFHKQDFWGYANANTSGKLLNVNNFFTPRKPNFDEASKGALFKIIYPTKGSTEFLYEANTYDPGEENLDDFYIASGVCADLTESKNVSVMTNAGSTGGIVTDIKSFTVTNEVYMKLNLHVTKNAWPGGEVYAGLRRLEDSPSGGISCTDSSLENCSDCSMAVIYYDSSNTPESSSYQEVDKTFNSSRQLRLIPGNYELYVTAIPEPTTCGTCGALAADASIEYSQEDVDIRSRETGGIRISKIKDCPDPTGFNCTAKEYIYETEEGVSQGHLFRTRNLYKDSYTYKSGDVMSCVISSTFYRYSSSSNLPLGGYMGNHVIYSKVIERMSTNGLDNGSKLSSYSYFPSEKDSDPEVRSLVVDEKEYRNGRVLKEQFLNSGGDEVKTINYNYSFGVILDFNRRIVNFKAVVVVDQSQLYEGGSLYASDYSKFYMNSDVHLINTEEINYFNSDTLTSKTEITYTSPQGFLKTKGLVNSKGNIVTTKYYYPEEVTSTTSLGETLTANEESAINELVELNQIATPIQIETTVEDVNKNILSQSLQRTNYKDWGLNSTGMNSLILPFTVQNSKSNITLEDRIFYHDYDATGNPIEVAKADGTHLVYIWGYNQQYPIAKIENTTFSNVQSAIATLSSSYNTLIKIQNISNADNDRTIDIINTNGSITKVGREGDLREALRNLRSSLSGAMVSTYTYDPLIGVTSMTDPKGYTVYYEYDAFNRLKYVKDAMGKLVSENKYHYKD